MVLNEPSKAVVITIDGPAGAGKSTIAKSLSRKLGYSYLDTGAMYRALTLKAIRQKINLEDEMALVQLAKRTSLDLVNDREGKLIILLDGENVSAEIRTSEVTNNTFYIARAPRVREIMVDWQRAIGLRTNVVVEGRDVGTVVFPQAQFKFYLDADFEVRARRRMRELQEQGKSVEEAQLKVEMQDRDYKDFNRTTGPLRQAADAIRIDGTDLTVDETAELMLTYIRKHG